MPTTVAGDVTRRIQSIMGDLSKTFISDADCFDWIMDAQHEISKITECLSGSAEFPTVANQHLYTLDDLVLKVQRVTLNNRRLRPTSVVDLDKYDPDRDLVTTGGVPTHYYVDSNDLGLWPLPRSSGQTIKIQSRNLSTQVINDLSDVLELPDFFRENIVRYCILKAREKDEQPEVLAMLFEDWRSKLGIAKSIMNNREDAYVSISDIESILDYN